MRHSIEQANRYIAENKHLVRPDYRLNYHLMSEAGWMNDPNGFVYYKGQYHLFFQHHPYKPVWGPMHWGHAVSRDLVRWTHLPVALAPDGDFDGGGCFSGSAIEQDGKLVLMYTGHKLTGEGSEDYKQAQGIAVSEDGVVFAKHGGNPVIGYGQIPANISQRDFRDPKVFEQDGQYYVVLGSNDGAGNGLALLYRSADLLEWTLAGELARSDGRFGDNWECPDLFCLGGTDVFMLSPQRMPAQGHQFRNLHSTMYMLGKLDAAQGRFTWDSYGQVDHGFDFYAPQSTLDGKGRRIVIGWMDMWETDMPTQQQDHGWAGAMSLPREAVLEGGRLLFRPLEELSAYRGDLYELRDAELSGERLLETEGDSYELEAEFAALDAEEFGVKLRVGDGEETVLAYDTGRKLLRLNRDRSGIGPKGERCAETELCGGKLSLRVFVDKSSVEVFVQDGERVMTARIYPGAQSLGIAVFAKGACRIASLRKWELAAR